MKQSIIAICLIFINIAVFAQDRNFTQFYASPLTFNPALTGAVEGRTRVILNYRNQWQSISPEPFTTTGISFDMNFNPYKKQMTPDKIGVGMSFFSDQVGSGEFSTNQLDFNGAFHKSLNNQGTHYLSGGFQFGIHQKTLAYNDLTFEDQFDGSTGYILATGEDLPANSFTFADLGAGIQWSLAPKDRMLVYAGASFFHLTQPDVSFYQDVEGVDISSRLYTRMTGHFGLQIPVGGKSSLQPRITATLQGPHTEVNAGANLSFSLSDYNDTNLILGSWFRPVIGADDNLNLDAIVALVGFQLSGFQVGVSYDINVSPLANATGGRGAFELSLMYVGSYENESIICPTF
jgi:type IX secretion system PorP/SprF family membrane protein